MEAKLDRVRENLIEDALNNVDAYRTMKEIAARYKNIEFYVAGGAIRSILLGLSKSINDIDIFAFFENEKSKDFQEFTSSLNDLGYVKYGQYGSPRWYHNKDGSYFDIVPYSKFDVGFGNPGTIDETLKQFDFTANAVAYNIFAQTLCNPVGGISDIDNKLLKAVRLDFIDGFVSKSVPISRLSVLWFRFVHYASKLDFEIEGETLKWINENSFRAKDIHLFEKYFFKPLTNAYAFL